MNYRLLSDEKLAELLACDSKMTKEQVLTGIRSENPALGREWVIDRLEWRADQRESSRRIEEHIERFSRALS